MYVDANDIETPRDFELMLRDAGFSRSRAKAITAKGFRQALSNSELDYGVDGDAIADVIRLIERRRLQLVPEIKKFGRLEFVAGPTWNDRWRVLGVISPSAPTNFRIAARSLNSGRLKGAFKLRVKYRSRRGLETATWLSNGGSAGNGPYLVNAGMQEILVKGMAPGIPQRIEVKWG